jgi:Predicted nucleotide-binding protein containing TIR-like domain
MQREVFIGSSTEGLEEANHVFKILSANPDLKCVPWKEVFQPGFLTFEALEAVLLRCCGAVFVAGPDDQTTIRGRAVNSPRANIMLEFGLMAGRMGRHNIALWQYGTVELPSDLKGLTVISSDPSSPIDDPNVGGGQAEQKLKIWSSRLSASANGIPRTEVVHGYSGRWDFDVNLQTWRDLPIVAPDYVSVKGHVNLIMPADGQTGWGLAHGRLYFRLLVGEARAYQGEYHTAHEIKTALCRRDGTLELITEAFAIQRVTSVCSPPPQLADLEFSPEPWTAKWTLVPSAGIRTLSGEVHSEGVVVSKGQAQFTWSTEIL